MSEHSGEPWKRRAESSCGEIGEGSQNNQSRSLPLLEKQTRVVLWVGKPCQGHIEDRQGRAWTETRVNTTTNGHSGSTMVS